MRKPCTRSSWGLGALLVFVLGACSSCAGRSTERARIVVRGSDTMAVLLKEWALAYDGARVEVSGGGSGTGIAALANGTTDIAAASRAMTAAERRSVTERAGAGAVEEVVVAIDAVAIYLHRDNPRGAFTLDEVARIYDGRTATWATLTGDAQPIARYSRENSSGTYAFFKERAVGGADLAPDVQCLPGTAAVVRAVASDRWAIGYGGVATRLGEGARGRGMRLAGILGESGEVAYPTMEDAATGRYPLARPLYLYVRAGARAEVRDFITWVDGARARAIIERAGFFPPPLGGART